MRCEIRDESTSLSMWTSVILLVGAKPALAVVREALAQMKKRAASVLFIVVLCAGQALAQSTTLGATKSGSGPLVAFIHKDAGTASEDPGNCRRR